MTACPHCESPNGCDHGSMDDGAGAPQRIVQVLCGCGWGSLRWDLEAEGQPVCPICGYTFPQPEEEPKND